MKLVQFQYNPKDFTPTTLLEKALSGHTGYLVISYEAGKIAQSTFWLFSACLVLEETETPEVTIEKLRRVIASHENYMKKLHAEKIEQHKQFARVATAARDSWNTLTRIKKIAEDFDTDAINRIAMIRNEFPNA